jgi:hypothetical protein
MSQNEDIVSRIIELLDGMSVSLATAALNEALRLLPNTSVVSVTQSSADQLQDSKTPQ